MKFRRAEAEESEEIAEVFRSVYTDKFPYYDPSEVEEDLKKDEFFSLVVEDKGEIIGFGQIKKPDYSFCDLEKIAMIARVAFKPGYQGQGLGTRLLEKLNQEIESRNLNYVFADLQTANCSSQKLVAKFDFKPVCFLFGLVPDFILENTNLTLLLTMKIAEESKVAREVYMPEKYRRMAGFIYGRFSLPRNVIPRRREFEVKKSFKEKVEEHLEKAREMEEEDNYVYDFITVDLTSPEAVSETEWAKKQGLEVDGLIPNLPKAGRIRDFLALRKRPEKIEYSKINVLSGENQELFQLVR